MGRRSQGGLLQGSSGSWASRIGTEWCGEGTMGVKEDGTMPATRNQGGGANSPAAVLGEIPELHGSGSRVKSLGSFLAMGRS
jgi:hypothetical protein